MTPEEMFDEELPFRFDFATRVLDKAEAIAGRRRKTRIAVCLVSGAIVVGAVVFGSWTTWLLPPPGAQRIPREIASIDPREISFTRGRPTSPLDFMFPDAAPLSQFSDEYAGGDDADALQNDLVFFPDAEEDAVVDGS